MPFPCQNRGLLIDFSKVISGWNARMRGLISYLRKGVLLSILLLFFSACGHGGGGGAAPPAAPAGVTASPADGKVTLSWDPVAGAASYNVYRAREGGVTKGNYFTLTEGKLYSEATSPLVDQVLTNGAAYYFVVTAVNGAGESAGSAEVSAVPTADVALPTVPTGVKATPGDRTVTLEWTASGATSYFVYMAERSGVTRNNWNTISGGKRIQVTSAATTYIQTGLTNGTPYYFVVTSANSLGQSSESKEVSATPFLAATVPAAPANLTASPGDQQITLRWDPAAAAVSYRIYWLHPASQPSPCPSA